MTFLVSDYSVLILEEVWLLSDTCSNLHETSSLVLYLLLKKYFYGFNFLYGDV